MNTQTTDPQLPWYRQFWPWFLIALPGSVVVAALYTLVLANRHADDLVVDEYYKEGLAINREIRRQTAADALGIVATVTTDGRQLDVQMRGDSLGSELRLLLSHPLEAERDFAVPLRELSPGHYRVLLPTPLEGRWHWIIDAGAGSPWRVDGEQHF